MIHPIPPGTRDVLPDEMRELRALTETLRACFERAGYGEISTPTMEYEEVLRTGDERAAGAGYRLFDEHGQVLVLRSDMTIPIARVVASRYDACWSRRTGSATSATPTAKWASGAARRASSYRPGSS